MTRRQTQPTTHTRNSGMTLLEVMIAAGVMVVAFVFIMGSIISVDTTADISEDQAVAMGMVSSILEGLSALEFEELLAINPAGDATATEETREAQLEILGNSADIVIECVDEYGYGQPLPIPVEYADYMPNPVEVRVTVHWADKEGRPFSMTSSTYYYRR